MMQTDVKAAYVTATATVFADRVRFKGLFVTPGSAAGTVVVRDGGANGTVVFSTTTLNGGTPFPVVIPGEGVLCYTDLHVTITGTATTAMVFYG
jgi:hypothetical protein